MADTNLHPAGTSALVTGGGSGLGFACAERLAAQGVHVVLAGRSRERLDGAVAQVKANGGAATAVVCDVADEAQVAEVAARAAAAGALRVVITSAGIGAAGPLHLTDLATWNQVLATNLTGTMLVLKHTADAMARAGGGSFVAISSIAGPLTHRWMSAYCVSKAGVETLVRNAADELGAVGIRVNAVRPGLVPTDISAPLMAAEPAVADYLTQMPLGRLGTVHDVAALVAFLASPEASWITGQLIGVDGGHTLRRGPDLTPVLEPLMGDALWPGR